MGDKRWDKLLLKVRRKVSRVAGVKIKVDSRNGKCENWQAKIHVHRNCVTFGRHFYPLPPPPKSSHFESPRPLHFWGDDESSVVVDDGATGWRGGKLCFSGDYSSCGWSCAHSLRSSLLVRRGVTLRLSMEPWNC